MKVTIHEYPYNKDFVFAVAIDDLHPESANDLEHLDFGSSPDKLPLQLLKKTMQVIPDIKFTLFTVPNWIDRSDLPTGWLFPLRKLYRKRRSYERGTFAITHKKNKRWVEQINNLPNVEIAAHGLFHHTDDLSFARSQEFGGLSNQEIVDRLKEMMQLFAEVTLHHSKGFRPPGWFTSKELINALRSLGFSYIATFADMKTAVTNTARAKNTGKYQQLLIHENVLEGLPNYVANCYPQQVQRAVEIAKQKGILLTHLHIAHTEWGLIAITKKFPQQMQTIVAEIKKQTIATPWFATLLEVTEFSQARKQISYQILNKEKIKLTNHSSIDLQGLTISVNNQSYCIDVIAAGKSTILNITKKPPGPLVSAILTVYNGEEMVRESLDSLAMQDYSNLEIIIVNDGSTDQTKKIIETYISETGDTRIRLINQDNKGRASAKNAGLRIAQGSIVTFCEDDAVYSKQYIAKAVRHFAQKNTLGVIGPHYVLNKNESVTTRVKDLERRANFLQYKPNSCWFYRKEDLTGICGFNETLEFGEDVAPAAMLKKKYPEKSFIFEPESIWLHQEPSGIRAYLRRKYRGGLGMVVLERMHIRPPLLGNQHLAFLALFLLCWGLILFVFPYLTLLLFCLMLIAAIALRRNTVAKMKQVSTESVVFIFFAVLYEYVWWVSTCIGYLQGKVLANDAIAARLMKR